MGAPLGPGSALAAVGGGAVPRALLALRGAVRGPLPTARAAPASPCTRCAGDAWGLQRPSCSPQLSENSLNSFSCFPPEQSFNQSINQILKRRSLSWGERGAVFLYVHFMYFKG